MSARALLAFAVAAALAAGCRGPAATPLAPGAAEALAEARRLERAGAAAADPARRAAVERARSEAPDWVAPMRAEDDLLLAERRGVEALERRRAELARDPADARLLYLAGRLDTERAEQLFAAALARDRRFAWARHGLAHAAARRGDLREALHQEARAIQDAREPWERAFFLVTRAGFQMQSGRAEEALRALRGALLELELAPADRLWLETETALCELRQRERSVRLEGHRRGLALLRERELAEADLLRIFGLQRALGFDLERGNHGLELALAAHSTPLRDALRAQLARDQAGSALGARLAERASAAAGGGDPLSRAERFALGDPAGAIEGWLARLPAQVLDQHGLPRDERLARIAAAARALGEEPLGGARRGALLLELGAALVDAGWFEEARALAELCSAEDLEAALALRTRAVAGLGLVEGLRDAQLELEGASAARAPPEPAHWSMSELRAGDAGSAREAQRAREQDPPRRGLAALLARMGELFARAAGELGGERDPIASASELARSPRLSFGPFATLVHPGPRFSPIDEEQGLGRAGEPVGGLAAAMQRIGRFAIVGEYFGGGAPDGTILRLLLIEERAGEHLGVRWRGTIAWCEGSDLEGRAGRNGARVSAAALHEGYWIDVEVVRREHAQWSALERAFRGPGALERVERALATRGLELCTPRAHAEGRERERRAIAPALGQADRVRLAVLRDRAPDARDERAPLGSMRLEELLEVVARHEEGHLLDRVLHLPIHRHLGRAMLLMLEGGFSGSGLLRRLELRAQLVALCTSEDPRIPLADLCAAAESEASGPLPHAAAYRELLAALLELLDQRVQRDPSAWPGIDPERTLLHQLHHLRAEEVRALARELARRLRVGAS